MIGDILKVMVESPLLMLVLVVDVFLIFLIISYVFSKFFGAKRPDRKLFLWIRKWFVKLKEGDTSSLETLYEYVINTYVHKGKISHDDGEGFKAREKILEGLEGEEKKIVANIFKGFESKKYGGGISDEQKTVTYLYDQFRSI